MKEHIRPPNPDDPADELDADGPQSSNKPDADEALEPPDHASAAAEVNGNSTGEEEDDDDFGDFEDASPLDEPVPSTSGSVPLSAQQSFDSTVAIATLRELSTGGSELWEQALEDEERRPSCSSVREEEEDASPTPSDLFAFFDEGKPPSETASLQTHEIDSVRLWARLCIIEEAEALKFVWNQSVAYSHFLDALRMDVAKAKASVKKEIPVFVPTPNGVLAPMNHSATSTNVPNGAIANHSSSSSVSTDLRSANIDATVDSLSVPPVNFDWQSSGLSNPLTGSSISAFSAVLECDFFTSDSSSSHTDGLSILQRDLDAWGLTDGATDSTDLHSFTPSLALDLQSLQSKQLSEIAASKKRKSPSELSVQARALYDALPDHSYMLSKVLMFPVREACE
ncbi:Protein Y45G5AM.9 a [Aphelenchoides avenae]|nr:Protein Y45G5AM.9 a [Aphelenchus avenae]